MAGLALTARHGRRARCAAALVGAGVLAGSETIARRRQRPGEIPALRHRILTTSAMAAPLGWLAERLTGAGPVAVATGAGAATGAAGLRPQKVLIGPLVGLAIGRALVRIVAARVATILTAAPNTRIGITGVAALVDVGTKMGRWPREDGDAPPMRAR